MTTPAKRIAQRLKVFGFFGVAAAGVVAWLVIAPPSFGDSTLVPAPDAGMATATADQLAKATAAQGVCYGWRLDGPISGNTDGSNLGPGVVVESDPTRCARWVEVRADVTWTSSSSEASDTAFVTIASAGVPAPPASRLDRFGLDTSAFIDEPDWAICQAALALPLLLAESGAVPPAPAPTAAAAAEPAPRAGSDFWRDRWPFVVGAAILLALAVLAILIGWFERKHQRTRAAARPKKPAAAKPAAPKQASARKQASAPKQDSAPKQASAAEETSAPERPAPT
jgi:hypothetical protein